ncbi:GtrA family protein [Candidatus Parcubacteria bacterium]|nr:GtrA family protein [Candidatus Parcubacteria bacterium]
MNTIVRTLKEMYRGGLRDHRVIQFIKFGSVGVLNTSVDLGLYFALTRFFAMNDLILVKGFSYLAATVVSFVMNRFWTFRKSSRVRAGEIGRFYASVAFALLVNTTAMYFFTSVAAWNDAVAALLATGLTVLWNFFSMKFWVYTEEAAYEERMALRRAEAGKPRFAGQNERE